MFPWAKEGLTPACMEANPMEGGSHFFCALPPVHQFLRESQGAKSTHSRGTTGNRKVPILASDQESLIRGKNGHEAVVFSQCSRPSEAVCIKGSPLLRGCHAAVCAGYGCSAEVRYGVGEAPRAASFHRVLKRCREGVWRFRGPLGGVRDTEALVLAAKAFEGTRDLDGVMASLEQAEALAAAGGGRYRGRAQREVEEAVAVTVRPPADMYETVARAYAREGRWEEAIEALETLQNLPRRRPGEKTRAGASTYELVMSAAAGGSSSPPSTAGCEAALGLADAARESGATPTTGWLATEVLCAGHLAQWERVAALRVEARSSPALGEGGGVGARFYSAYIEAASLCGKPEQGLDVLREMEAGG
ncbi:unnamed protein product, partial [Discosporangium mesarthrocarpum]